MLAVTIPSAPAFVTVLVPSGPGVAGGAALLRLALLGGGDWVALAALLLGQLAFLGTLGSSVSPDVSSEFGVSCAGNKSHGEADGGGCKELHARSRVWKGK